MPHRSRTLGLAAAVAVLISLSAGWSTASAAGSVYYVSPSGADTNTGTSAGAPFRTIQKALDVVGPGSTIALAPGTYTEALVTRTAGTAAYPIAIRGPETGTAASGRYKAVVRGTGGKVLSINHSWYTIDGFTIDGQAGIDRSEYPTTLAQVRAFKDSVQSRAVNSKLVYVGADAASADITGTRISNMFLTGSGGECVRFRNRAADSLVVGSVIQWCGMYASVDDVAKYEYHNGEGVYVGTSPKSTDQPMYANDTSTGIVVRDSVVRTFGSECFEVKENAHDNRIEDSDCGMNDEPLSFDGSNIELRGDHNLVRRTTVHDSRGWNVKLQSDSSQYDKGGNSVEQSSFTAAAGPALRGKQSAAGSTFCGNTFSATPYTDGTTAFGDPRAACAVDVRRPTAAITAPAAGATVSGTVPITVAAADDKAVTRVDFAVDGGPLGSDAAAPWSQDWTVPAAPGTHTIAVTAYDAAANATTTSVTVTGGPAPRVIALEAEAGTVAAPMAVATDSRAQGGKYVVQSSGSGTGTVTYRVTVPAAGSYALAARVIGPSTSSDSMSVAVDGGAAQVLNFPSTARTAWTWSAGPAYALTAGTHTLVVAKRENGARLDALTLTLG